LSTHRQPTGVNRIDERVANRSTAPDHLILSADSPDG
jgi:hypothetical protein